MILFKVTTTTTTTTTTTATTITTTTILLDYNIILFDWENSMAKSVFLVSYKFVDLLVD